MKFYTRQRRMPQVIIVSLIDIFAILLIFVIVTTTFKKDQPPAVSIKLPESAHSVASETADLPLVLTITETEEIYLDAEKVTQDELRARLADMVKKNSQQRLALNADKKAPFGTVIGVIDIMRDAGIKGNLPAFMEKKK